MRLIFKFQVILALLIPGNALFSAGLTLAGSSTIQPLTEVAAQAFMALHPGTRIDVQGGGSSVGIAAPQKGLADIGMVSRALHPDEVALLRHWTVAKDGIALIAHRSNRVKRLTKEQVVKIYEGKIRNWSELGGLDLAMTVVNKEEGRSTLELFEKHFGLQGRFRTDLIIIGPNGQAISTVASDPSALAYVSIGSAEVAVSEGTQIKLLDLDGVKAGIGSVRSGRYPLLRELNLVTQGAPSPEAQSFIDFLLSPVGQELVVRQDFVPVAEGKLKVKGAGARKAEPTKRR